MLDLGHPHARNGRVGIAGGSHQTRYRHPGHHHDGRASRAKRKNRTKKKETSAASDGDVSPEDKSARKAARASRKAERGESESEESSDRTRRRKALAARRKRKKGKEKGDGGADEESGPRPLRIFLNGLNETSQSALRQAIERKLAGQALEWPAADQKADIAFYAFDDPPDGTTNIVPSVE